MEVNELSPAMRRDFVLLFSYCCEDPVTRRRERSVRHVHRSSGARVMRTALGHKLSSPPPPGFARQILSLPRKLFPNNQQSLLPLSLLVLSERLCGTHSTSVIGEKKRTLLRSSLLAATKDALRRRHDRFFFILQNCEKILPSRRSCAPAVVF